MAYADRTEGLSELARYGFVDLSATVGKLDQLVALVGDSGRAALAPLGTSADPDQALNGLLSLAADHKEKVRSLLKKADSADRLCKLLGASSALTDFLRRQPENLSVFEKQVATIAQREGLVQTVLAEVAPVLRPGFDLQTAWNKLRVAYRRELLKIAIFDLCQPDVIAAQPLVAAGLADIAAAAVEAGLAVARAELTFTSDHGAFTAAEVAGSRLAVIAMGKCGARELNYISDVDVIYVAESGSEEVDSHRALEVATKLATRMMRAMDGTSQEPMLWQVDPNLRPEGKSGALVRTLDSHVAYYDRWAKSWEFQALLKARPLAGDLALGQDYVTALAPKVWASASRENFVESVQKMRERVSEYIPADEVDRQIKLGPGGLRDIEFTVQLLQLVHGRADDTVRQRDTISAITALAAAGYVGRAEASQFSNHYRFLRLLEHRIQLSEMRRTHLMPTNANKLRALARSVDTKLTTDGLLSRWESVKLEVRALHQKIFYRPLLSAVSKLGDESLELTSVQAEDRLHAIGFDDGKGALKHIEALTSGLSRRASIQKQLLPVLLQWFSEGSDPDSALLAFRRLSEDLGESPWYLRMLRDSSGAARRMTQVLSNSKLATNLFEKIPEAAAWFENSDDLVPLNQSELQLEFSSILSRHQAIDTAAAALRAIRRRETLRIAIGAVLGDSQMADISSGLSDLSAAYLRALVEAIFTFDVSSPGTLALGQILDFGIVAMGRFGGQELGFGSDADVMFVYRTLEGADGPAAQKAAERIVAELQRLSKDPVLEFEIDLDLRPEGKNGPVARSLDSYAAYYERWANTWESQALLRANPIVGSPALISDFLQLIDKYRYPELLTDAAVIEIRRIKARVENERLPQGADARRHLKLGRGSLSDVEWLVQLIQLRHGSKHPGLQTPRTLEALGAAVEEGFLAEHDARVLSEAWLLSSRIRSAAVLWTNKLSDVLPTDRNQLEAIARLLEYPRGSATALEQDYLAFTRRARVVFERVFYG